MHLDQLGSLRLVENKESLVQEDFNLPDCLFDQSLAQRLRERTLLDLKYGGPFVSFPYLTLGCG